MAALTANQKRAAELVARGLSDRDVATELGCGHRTISEWRQLPEFRAFQDSLNSELVDLTRQNVVKLVNQTCEVIELGLANMSRRMRQDSPDGAEIYVPDFKVLVDCVTKLTELGRSVGLAVKAPGTRTLTAPEGDGRPPAAGKSAFTRLLEEAARKTQGATDSPPDDEVME